MRQRLTDFSLPLRVCVEDCGALRDVAADRGHKIDSAEGAEVIASAGQISPHLVHPVLAAALRAFRYLVAPADADQAAALVVREWGDRVTLQAGDMRGPGVFDDQVSDLPDALSAHMAADGWGRWW